MAEETVEMEDDAAECHDVAEGEGGVRMADQEEWEEARERSSSSQARGREMRMVHGVIINGCDQSR